jgi:hypothetical protein
MTAAPPVLRIAEDLALPIEFATEASAIVARRSRGKTYTAGVAAEELHAAGQPFAVLDPTGAWFGLRSSADGKRPGLPVTILGGEHGDVPLEQTGGKVVANYIVANPGAYIIDLSAFESNAAQDRFVADFLETLYRSKASDEQRTPLTLICDEADSFAPQKPQKGQERMLGAMEAIVRRGRFRGLGVILICQRPAVLNKNVLTQVALLILLGITGPQDRAAVDDWIKGHATEDQRRQVLSSLASFGVGEAWVWWPDQDLLRQVKVRRRRTFDSSATPKAGAKRVGPVAFAPVDLDAIKEAMVATIERTAADDPKQLRAQILALRKELAATRSARPEAERVEVEVPVEVQVPVLEEELVIRLEEALSPFAGLLGEVQERLAWETTTRGGMIEMRRKLADRAEPPPRRADRLPGSRGPGKPAPQQRTAPTAISGDARVGKGEQTVMAVLAQWPQGRTHNELAFLAGYSAKASTLGVILSKLRKLGYVTPGGPVINLTAEGLDAAGGAVALPAGADLLAHWRGHQRMGDGERRVLDVLVASYPTELSHDELCELAGYSASASTIGVILSKLRKLGLVEKGVRRLAPEFAEAIS